VPPRYAEPASSTPGEGSLGDFLEAINPNAFFFFMILLMGVGLAIALRFLGGKG
jgi:hypothetical protein